MSVALFLPDEEYSIGMVFIVFLNIYLSRWIVQMSVAVFLADVEYSIGMVFIVFLTIYLYI